MNHVSIGRKPKPNDGQHIDRGGNPSVDGNVDAGGDFVGRDRVTIGQFVVVMGGSRREVEVKRAPEAGESPYRGLEVFNVADAALFFGRERVTAQLAAALCETSFLAVVGASGSGKSSLVRVGLIPALQQGELPNIDVQLPQGSREWPVQIALPSDDPLMPLAASLTWDQSIAEQLKPMDAMRQDVRRLNDMAQRMLSRPDRSLTRRPCLHRRRPRGGLIVQDPMYNGSAVTGSASLRYHG